MPGGGRPGGGCPGRYGGRGSMPPGGGGPLPYEGGPRGPGPGGARWGIGAVALRMHEVKDVWRCVVVSELRLTPVAVREPGHSVFGVGGD